MPVSGGVGLMMEETLSTIALAALPALEEPRAFDDRCALLLHGCDERAFKPRLITE